MIEVGSRWKIKDESGDPFPAKDNAGVTVLDYRDGWVRYKVGAGVVFGDERMQEEAFKRCYVPA